ncbi:hypothetical protein BC832DRAFT_539989 [Gaertneriomyces semiglobifer]|nr:hypothetical protein BC832DRAFT_539989 [Gaertneriomyces semiglobifer]
MVCLELYSKPVYMSCGHVLCAKCALALLGVPGKFRCPSRCEIKVTNQAKIIKLPQVVHFQHYTRVTFLLGFWVLVISTSQAFERVVKERLGGVHGQRWHDGIDAREKRELVQKVERSVAIDDAGHGVEGLASCFDIVVILQRGVWAMQERHVSQHSLFKEGSRRQVRKTEVVWKLLQCTEQRGSPGGDARAPVSPAKSEGVDGKAGAGLTALVLRKSLDSSVLRPQTNRWARNSGVTSLIVYKQTLYNKGNVWAKRFVVKEIALIILPSNGQTSFRAHKVGCEHSSPIRVVLQGQEKKQHVISVHVEKVSSQRILGQAGV